MKIRIKGNSVRLRLTKSEVEQFCAEGNYGESTVFNNQTFTYALVAKEGVDVLETDYMGNTITVYIPMEAKETWYSSNRIGYSNVMNPGTEREFTILVEKDFVCMDETIEDQSDNYPNPKL